MSREYTTVCSTWILSDFVAVDSVSRQMTAPRETESRNGVHCNKIWTDFVAVDSISRLSLWNLACSGFLLHVINSLLLTERRDCLLCICHLRLGFPHVYDNG
jgi:hypothetical protein